eukprot:TRINITY_DN18125_c0_g1_i1.p2 TRINITY_DN18125_c0_g1~~TRINITY_DN18125_c0_g1_i1.p2  ORF type:complete len:156 (-),score=22.08 TRINITY_DN18125_c0_g1_i1:219-686(-)
MNSTKPVFSSIGAATSVAQLARMAENDERPGSAFEFPVQGYLGHRPTWSRELPKKMARELMVQEEAEQREKQKMASMSLKRSSSMPGPGSSRPGSNRSRPLSQTSSMARLPAEPASKLDFRFAGEIPSWKYRPSSHAMPGYTGHKPMFWQTVHDY